MRIDTRALELFVAVATCLSFRQAAEGLHMTQPPLSRAIRQLEERLGQRLFERDTQRVALTAAGKALLPRAQKILALLDGAVAAVQALDNGIAAPLRLGLTTSVEAGSFRALTAALPMATPYADTSPRLVAALRAGRLDAAIVALPTRKFDLAVEPLGAQPLLAALPSAHPLARRRRIALADLADAPLYWFERARQPAFFDHCHAVFARHGFTPRLLREPQDHHVLLAGIAAGAGIALLPASFAALRLRGVVYRPLREGAELALRLGLALAGAPHPAADELRRAARAHLGEAAWAASPGRPRRNASKIAAFLFSLITDMTFHLSETPYGTDTPEAKQTMYADLRSHLTGLVHGETDWIANTANFSSLVFNTMPGLNWAGFYFLKTQDELVLGPFQGKPACIRIKRGRGVCGTTVEKGEAIVVADVHEFPGHIACDVNSRSELVVPVFAKGEIIGVFDLDSPLPNRFDAVDAEGIGSLVKILEQTLETA